MTNVTLITRPDCHLCDPVRDLVRAAADELQLAVTEVNIDDDESLAEFRTLIPVVLVNGEKIAHWTLSRRQLQQAVKTANSPWRQVARKFKKSKP